MSRTRTAPVERGRASREVELSLVVTDPNPEDVFRRLARLRHLDGYLLRPRGSDRIVDWYYDTPDEKLRKRGIALRLRALDGSCLIGIKGRRRTASTRTEDRFERERPFSTEAAADIARRIGLRTERAERADTARMNPREFLESSIGVHLVQRRETVRLVREVMDGREPTGPLLAELALDRVQFDIRSRIIRHYEVEVESKLRGRGTKAARAVAAELSARYPDQLQEWPYGKLPTGTAIEALLAKDALDGVNSEGVVTTEGYTRIKRYLARRR